LPFIFILRELICSLIFLEFFVTLNVPLTCDLILIPITLMDFLAVGYATLALGNVAFFEVGDLGGHS
jgi:hypothetical protein